MIYDNDDLVEYDARVYRANANNYVRLETANPDDYEYFSITDYDAMRKIPRHHDCIKPFIMRLDLALGSLQNMYMEKEINLEVMG